MSRSLRIVVADDEPRMREWFRKVLPILGHEVVAAAETGRQLVEHCRSLHPDLVITDIKMPDMDGIEAAVQFYRDGPVPVILVSAYHDHELIERAEADHIMAFLVKPIKQAHLEPAIGIAIKRFSQFQELRNEAANLRQALADRKIIERAKGLLMKQSGIDEEEAFRRLQKLARDKNRKLVEIAEMFLVVDETLSPPDQK
jgi:response regulator NasT